MYNLNLMFTVFVSLNTFGTHFHFSHIPFKKIPFTINFFKLMSLRTIDNKLHLK